MSGGCVFNTRISEQRAVVGRDIENDIDLDGDHLITVRYEWRSE